DALASVSRAIRRDLERAERKLSKMGALDVTVTDLTTLPADYNQLVTLHTLRWQSAGSPGIFGTDYYRRFFLAGFTGLARAGLLRLLTIRLDGKPIAVTCGFAQRRHYYHFITGYDPEWSSLSPGTLAVYVALRAAVHEGAVCFDFLRGKEAYKYRWGAQDHPTYRRRLRPMRGSPEC
ncbi:MAG: GNAT family N-acetyltransferase, partial [Verrucomicrobia bacterium]|nr:GNAT family N-acetyltransferase [Verrucomicrobiota bacterium]